MDKVPNRLLILFLVTVWLAFSACHASRFQAKGGTNAEEKLYRRPVGRKITAFFANRTQTRAERKQEKKKRARDKEYQKSIIQSQKRAYEIQTAEVRLRMTKDREARELRDKERKKKAKLKYKKPEIQKARGELTKR
jgi:hypothetical protein